MKLNKILMVLAATAIVGCTSDDLNDFSAKQAPEDSRLVELSPNFVLAGVGEDDAITRTHWEQPGGAGTALKNKFLPIWDTAPAGGNTIDTDADLEAQAVGLCWLGTESGKKEVYTNYQFFHFGWLKTGETDAKFECDELTNGALYSEIKVNSGDAAGAEADETKFVLPTTPINKSSWTLNYNSGVYKTDNKSIFTGDYIVYYPFNEDFNEIGTIPAIAETKFSPVPVTLADPALGEATFRYSAPVSVEGGAKAAGFGMYNLSALVQLKVKGTSGGNIDQIVLWSKKEQLLEQANLAANEIVAGKKGTELYDTKVGTKTIVATLGTPDNVTTTHDVNAFITALPTTVEDLVVYVHRKTDGYWAKKTIGSCEFKPNTGKLVTINVAAADFQKQYIAVDELSLKQALTDAAGLTATIEVIGDITLTKNLTINEPNITIKGDKIIVPEAVTLTVKAIMESDVRVLGRACCTKPTPDLGGRLVIMGGTLGNVTMEPAARTIPTGKYDDYSPLVTYDGAATIAAGKTFDAQAGNIVVNDPVQHKGNLNIAEGVKLTVVGTADGEDGDLNFMGSTVVNNGTIEVKKGAGFDITDSKGDASWSDGQNMTNNGKFIHNVDAEVGTAVQNMTQNGEYRCRVNKQVKLDDAYQKWLACSVIEITEAPETYDLGVAEKNINYKHNGKFIDIEVNTTGVTQFKNPTPDDKEINIGNLTVVKGGLSVDYSIIGTPTGKRALIVNGDMVVKANTSLNSSKKIDIKQNLTLDGAWLYYKGGKWADGSLKNEALAITGDFTVKGTTFDAGDVDALNITCANFTLTGGASANFGNRTEGDTKNMTVSGTISNKETTSTFSITAANQDGNGSVLATITCTKLLVGGSFPGGKPQVVAP